MVSRMTFNLILAISDIGQPRGAFYCRWFIQNKILFHALVVLESKIITLQWVIEGKQMGNRNFGKFRSTNRSFCGVTVGSSKFFERCNANISLEWLNEKSTKLIAIELKAIKAQNTDLSHILRIRCRFLIFDKKKKNELNFIRKKILYLECFRFELSSIDQMSFSRQTRLIKIN